MGLKETVDEYYRIQGQIVIVLVPLIFIIATPIVIYNYFNLFRFHKQKVELNCNQNLLDLAIKDPAFVNHLYSYAFYPNEFNKISKEEKELFDKNTIEIKNCQVGWITSYKSDFLLKILIINKYTDDEFAVYVPKESIHYIE